MSHLPTFITFVTEVESAFAGTGPMTTSSFLQIYTDPLTETLLITVTTTETVEQQTAALKSQFVVLHAGDSCPSSRKMEKKIHTFCPFHVIVASVWINLHSFPDGFLDHLDQESPRVSQSCCRKEAARS